MDFDIVQKLKNKRKEIGAREGKELFMILSNATIDAMVAAMPQTKEELIQVKGWGEKKIKMYGDAFLEVLRGAPIQASLIDEVEQTGPKRIAIQIGEEVAPVMKQDSSAADGIPETSSQFQEQPQSNILSVSEFLGNLNITLAEFGQVQIKGKIDEAQIRTGYAFFTLKESIGGFSSEAALGCFVSWRALESLQHLLQNGMEVVISGYPKIYLKNGSFRLEVTDIEPVGEGALQKAFEALKRKLEEKGYFDLARKRPIPPFIRTIGLITSMNGAVIEDFKKNIGPCGFQVECLDVRVEGDIAEENIVRAIRYFNDYKSQCDVLVVIRGGGSLQSLKAFNSEAVADALYYSRIPVITGIGHDKDETIAGFVSDLNCSTPTAVANFLRTQHETLQAMVMSLGKDLVQTMNGKFSEKEVAVRHASRYLISATEKIFREQHIQVNTLHEQLRFGLQRIFIGFQNKEKLLVQAATKFYNTISTHIFQVKIAQENITHLYKQKLQSATQNIELLGGKIACLNPEAILSRGYSITYGANGKVVKNAQDTSVGDSLVVRLHQGKISTEVKSIET